MAELRWILLLVGVGLVAAIYWWSKKKMSVADAQRATAGSDHSTRSEPLLDPESESSGDGRRQPSFETTPIDDRRRADESEQRTGDSATLADSQDKKIVSFRVCAKGGAFLNGLDVVKAMMDAGLMHGDFQIFHRMGPESGRIWFSIANMLEPGTFDLSKLEDMNTPGLTFFMMLPGDADGVTVFTDMLSTARQIADRLNCELLDEKGSSLSAQAAGFIKEEIIQFQHHSA